MKAQGIEEIAEKLGIDTAVVSVLFARGLTDFDSIRSFLYDTVDNLTDYRFIPNIETAANMVRRAMREGKRILVYGDYDCDGICAVSILVRFFLENDYQADYFIPDRNKDGYGMNLHAVQNIINAGKTDFVITVDCGVSAAVEIDTLQRAGIEVLVTDHHNMPPTLPNCLIVNAKTSYNASLTDICGAVTALRLVEALTDRAYVSRFYDIAAIATVADMVPLLYDNRLIVKEGLRRLNGYDRRIGIKRLLDNSNINRPKLTSEDIAFYIAPKINSAGRVDKAQYVPKLFLEEDYFLADTLSARLVELNKLRQTKCDTMYAEALVLLRKANICNKKAIVLCSPKWEAGVIGITAARLAAEFNRPTVLFAGGADGVLKGSARTCANIDLYELLRHFSHLYASFGGHSGACGLAIQPENLLKLEQELLAYLEENYSAATFLPALNYDMELSPKVSMDYIADLSLLEPFGTGNPRLTYLIKSPLSFAPLKDTHLKGRLNKDVDVLAFSYADKEALFNSDSDISYKVSLELNEFRGKYRGQAKLLDYRLDKIGVGLRGTIVKDNSPVAEKSMLSLTRVASYAEAAQLMGCNHYGTVYVTFSYNCYAQLLKQIELNGKNAYFHGVEYGAPKGNNPINRLIFAPSGGEFLSFYKRIVFLKKPPDSSYVHKLCKAFYGEAYYVDA